MLLLGLVALLHLPLLIQAYTAHNSDALRMKCDALPYRSAYSDYRCHFAVLRKVEYSRSAKECSSIFSGSKIAEDVPAQAFSVMMLNKQDFHLDNASTGLKYTICAVEVDHQCDSDSYMLSAGRCITRAAKKMNYDDAANYCQNLGMTLPSPANNRDNLIMRDALWKDPAWVQRFATEENTFKWKQGNDFSMWSACDRPGGHNPRLYAAFQNSLWSCAKNTASVVDKSGFWSNAGTDYLMDVICMKPATNAFSTKASCPALSYLTPSLVSSFVGVTVDNITVVTVDNTQATQISPGVNQLKCSSGTQFAYIQDGSLKTSSDWWMTCETDDWKIRDAAGKSSSYAVGPVGCIKPMCTGMLLFDGSEPLLASHRQFQFIPTLPSYVNGKWEFACPSGSSIGYNERAGKFTFAPEMRITCDAAGWWVRTPNYAPGGALAPVKIGCFRLRSANCPALSYLTPSLVSPFVGVTVDNTQDTQISPGVNQLKCPPGTQFALIREGELATFDWHWRMTCEDSATNGWRIRDVFEMNNPYEWHPVGCIKTTCTGMLLFDGSESLLTSKRQYQFVPTIPTFVLSIPSNDNGKWELACPSDSSIGIAETPTQFKFSPSLRITCDAAGWRVRDSSISHENALAPVKIGCFRKKIVPSANCPALSYLTPSQVSSFVGVTVDNIQATPISAGVNQLKCPSGTQFAYIQDGSLKTASDWWMTCETDGWKIKDAGGKSSSSAVGPVGCIKPKCTGMMFFAGSEPLLASHRQYQFVPSLPSYVHGKWEFACPSGSSIGYNERLGKFTFAPEMRITCDAAGWWVRTPNYAPGGPLATVKIGCFRAL